MKTRTNTKHIKVVQAMNPVEFLAELETQPMPDLLHSMTGTTNGTYILMFYLEFSQLIFEQAPT